MDINTVNAILNYDKQLVETKRLKGLDYRNVDRQDSIHNSEIETKLRKGNLPL